MRNAIAKPNTASNLKDIIVFNLDTQQYGILTGANIDTDTYSVNVNGEYIDIPMNSVLFECNPTALLKEQPVRITNKADLAYGNTVLYKGENGFFELYIRKHGETSCQTSFKESNEQRKSFINFLIHAFNNGLLYKLKNPIIKENQPSLFKDHKYNYNE
jgi:hypothetical protein